MFTNKYGTRLIELQNNIEGVTFGKNPDGTSWQKLLGMREVEYDHKPFKVGDILYVRETWEEWTGGYAYKVPDPHATYNYPASFIGKWKPSLHMPKEAARIFLLVKAVRVERLQDITEEEAVKEGIRYFDEFAGGYHWSEDHETGGVWDTAKGCFEWGLWNSTIDKVNLELYGREANPWVWIIEFERISKEETI